MYINFWYPVAKAEEILDDKPLRVQILGLKFVAFRDSGDVARVLSDTCIHRGGALGKGWVRDGRVICPYHGWQYESDGKCSMIPTYGKETKPPARAKVDSYPTQEKYGIVFVFLGDLPEEERPPVFEIPEYDDEKWRVNNTVVFEVNAYYERSVENGLDAAHNEFVHPLQGAPSVGDTLRRHPIEIEEIPPWGSQFLVAYAGGSKSEDTKVLGAGEGSTRAGSGHYGPNTLITRIIFSEVKAFAQYFFEAPIDESHTRIFFVNIRSFMMEEDMDQKLIDMNMKIAGEDIEIIEALDPIRTPHCTTKEFLTPADKPIVRFREFLQEWEDKGWRIDQSEFRAKRGDVAYAIPSPDRREHKNWVLDSIPLMPARN
jgi:phenylpropionate dioxygenase-like ring-hydroxylating dioxygenase large terminal subunit